MQIGVAPLAVGLIFSAGVLIGGAAGLGVCGWLVVVGVAAADFGFGKVHPLWLIGAGALFGLAGLV